MRPNLGAEFEGNLNLFLADDLSHRETKERQKTHELAFIYRCGGGGDGVGVGQVKAKILTFRSLAR